MRIAVIGAGKVGGTVGSRWEAAGYEVVYGLRQPAKKNGAMSIGDALISADVVLLAIPGAAVAQFAAEHGKELDGKIVIDATNNFGGSAMHCWPEILAAAPNARLYRAFNSYGWDVYSDPLLGGEKPDLFYCGPEGAGQKTVEELISDAGLRPVRVGDVDQADTVDGVLRLWFNLAKSRGRRIGFKLVSD